MRLPFVIVLVVALATGFLFLRQTTNQSSPSSVPPSLDTAGATQLLSDRWREAILRMAQTWANRTPRLAAPLSKTR